MLHLVTDRRRLWPSASDAEMVRCLVTQAGHAVRAGVDVIQVRERDLDAAALLALTKEIVALAAGSRTRVVVNERLDVALAAGAGGVHLPAASLPVRQARSMSPEGFLIGRSVHDVIELDGALGADYVIAGTVWPTPSKPDPARRLLGIEGLALLAARAPMPVLAIGGVTRERMKAVAAAGAAGAASIGMFLDDTAEGCRACDVTRAVADARRAFDTPGSGS
jgi:thiamine-phosphate pyrophosphorylase